MLPWQALLTNGRIFQLPEGNMAQHLSIQGVRYISLQSRPRRCLVAVSLCGATVTQVPGSDGGALLTSPPADTHSDKQNTTL